MALKAPTIQDGVNFETIGFEFPQELAGVPGAAPAVSGFNHLKAAWAEGSDRQTPETTKGFVFDLQRFSVHDGPGIRTLVLLKGCPLRCLWCCNPESQTTKTQVVFFGSKCIRKNGYDCRECLGGCPRDAIELPQNEVARVNQDRCEACGQCVPSCPASAIVSVGQSMTVEEVFAQVEQDAVFYRHSGGGVTLSGGEPAMQPDFAAALLRRCRSAKLHTALETCGHARWESIAQILPHLDLVLYDIKHMEPETHRALTGVSNEMILDNARGIAQTGIPMAIRVPVIPGHNDSEANIRATATFALDLGVTSMHLLPYHRLGTAKYHRLQVAYQLAELRAPDASHMQALREIVQSYGIDVQLGG